MEDWDLQASSDVTFLGLVLWREARGEEYECKLAVACSIMNRVNRPSWWGRTLLEVITKKWQYSSMTDPKDRQLTTWPRAYDDQWLECLRIAREVLMGHVPHPAPGADTYHDDSITTPASWGGPVLVRKIGHILFFNMDRDVEQDAIPPAAVQETTV